MKKSIICIIATLVLAPGIVSADLVDFESETIGAKLNGYVTDDSGLVSFTDSAGSELVLGTWPEGLGKSLGTWDDVDNSHLIMDFTTMMSNISLDFGNDDQRFTNAGDKAILTLFDGAVQVGQVAVEMNRNDLMDQTISYSGVGFNRATFLMAATLNPNPVNGVGLIEIVDNISFTPVPVPGAFVLGALGIGVAGRRLRKRKSA